MRKANKIMMMTVSVLLCLVLFTSTALSGTLAKYSTSGESSTASARVAAWGVGIDIFVDETAINNTLYKDFVDENVKIIVDKSGTNATVEVSNLMMGPGDCLRDLLKIRFDGDAEVKLQVKVSQGILYGGDYAKTDDAPKADYTIFHFGNNEYYVPIGFTFAGLDYNDNTKEYAPIINDKNNTTNYEYAVKPWCYGKKTGGTSVSTLPGIGMNKKEDAYMTYVAGKFEEAVKATAADGSTNVAKRDAYITKTFAPNAPIVFKTADGNSEVDTLAFGVEWPFTWSSTETDGRKKTEAEYDELATQFGRNVAANQDAYYIKLVYNISITQVNT